MELLTSLGINSSIWIQLVIFTVTYFLLSRIVFKPYLSAFSKREESTVGGEKTAEKLILEVEDLTKEFDEKSKKLSSSQMEIYNEARSEAQKSYNDIVQRAQGEAEQAIDSARVKVKSNVEQVKQDMISQVPTVSKEIVSKLVGKGL